MKYSLLWLFLFIVIWVDFSAFAERPVLVELYSTSSRDCRTCPDALDAINQIRAEFPETLLHYLYFPIKDSLQTESGFIRYKIDYSEPNLPTVFFDGSNRITGADSNIDDAYRNNVQHQISQPRNGRIYSWQEQSGGTIITQVTYSLPANIPDENWELMLIGALDHSDPLSSVVQFVKTVDTNNVIKLDGWIVEIVEQVDEELQCYWIIQERDPISLGLGEVLLSSRAATQTVVSADYTFDGVINHEDLFIFSALWNLRNRQADLNQDGLVDQLDVLTFHELAME